MSAAARPAVMAQPCQVCGRRPNPMRLGPNHGRWSLSVNVFLLELAGLRAGPAVRSSGPVEQNLAGGLRLRGADSDVLAIAQDQAKCGSRPTVSRVMWRWNDTPIPNTCGQPRIALRQSIKLAVAMTRADHSQGPCPSRMRSAPILSRTTERWSPVTRTTILISTTSHTGPF